jgi:hypothetical protein
MAHPHPQRAIHQSVWHWPRAPAITRSMTMKRRFTQAGGSILAISIIAGTVAGVIVGQSSIGFLVGVAAGTVLLVLFWLQERRR